MQKKHTLIVIFLFFVIVLAPISKMSIEFLRHKSHQTYLYQTIKSFSQEKLNEYILNYYGFRKSMTRGYMSLFLKVFKESPIPKKVVLGKKDWLFLGDGYNNSYSSAIGSYHFPDSILDNTLNNIININNYCDSIGCGFYLVIAPDKNNIYSEYLNEKPNSTIRFREALVNKLKDRQSNIIDLYPYIKGKKEDEILYYRTDSHWNFYGGYLASRYVVNIINKRFDLTPLDEKYISIDKTKLNGVGDLDRMLILCSDDLDFKIVDHQNIQLSEKVITDSLLSKREVLFIQNNTLSNKSRAIIFKDSFFESMKSPFLKTLQEAVVFSQYTFDSNVVNKIIKEQGKPNFIIFEVVERNLTEIKFM